LEDPEPDEAFRVRRPGRLGHVNGADLNSAIFQVHPVTGPRISTSGPRTIQDRVNGTAPYAESRMPPPWQLDAASSPLSRPSHPSRSRPRAQDSASTHRSSF